MVRSRPVSPSVNPGQFISARYRDTKASSIPAAVPSPVVTLVAAGAAVVAATAETPDRPSSGCASAQPAVNQAAVERLLRSRDLRFIENAETNDVEARVGSDCMEPTLVYLPQRNWAVGQAISSPANKTHRPGLRRLHPSALTARNRARQQADADADLRNRAS